MNNFFNILLQIPTEMLCDFLTICLNLVGQSYPISASDVSKGGAEGCKKVQLYYITRKK